MSAANLPVFPICQEFRPGNEDGIEARKRTDRGTMLGSSRACELALHASSITELFDVQLRNFDEALGQLGYTKEMASSAGGGNQSGDLAKLYSMESERKLHLEVFGGSSSPTEGTLTVSGNQKGSEFGADVELF